MEQNIRMDKKDMVSPIIVFFVLLLVTFGSFFVAEKKMISEKKESSLYIAANQANIMKDSVDTSIARVYTFSALVRDNEGNTDFFDREAAKIYQEIVTNSGIPLKNVAIAPDGVVEKVYPVVGNEKLVGFDFMDTSKEGNTEAVEAYERGDVVVTNPFKLVQGGLGMAGRLPVFVERDGKEYFWGLVTVTLDFDKMIDGFHLTGLSDQKLKYSLRYQDEQNGYVEMAASGGALKDPVTYAFKIQNLKWYLDVEPVDGWFSYLNMIVAGFFMLAFCLLIALLIYDKNRIRYANGRLEQLAHLDGLTSCFSRHYVNTILVNQKTGEWNHSENRYSLAIIDIDYFKAVNDSFGHAVGDRVIVAVAQILKDSTCQADGDCVIRHGGDEFIMLWNDVTKERFQSKMKELVENVEKIHFPDYPALKLSVSIGGEHYEENCPKTYIDMIKKADKKLYQAKKNGRNQFVE